MNTVSNVGSTSASSGLDASSALAGGQLSPEALILYCQTHLKELKDQIDGLRKQAEKNNDIQKQLAKLKSDLEALDTGHEGDDNRQAKYDIIVEMKKLYDDLKDKDPAAADSIDKLYQNFCRIVCNGGQDVGYKSSKRGGGEDPYTMPLRSLGDWKLGEPYSVDGNSGLGPGGGNRNWVDKQGKTMDAAAWWASINKQECNISDDDRRKLLGMAGDTVDGITKGEQLDMNDLQGLVQQQQQAIQITMTMMQHAIDAMKASASNGK